MRLAPRGIFMDDAARPILFVSLPEAGLINPLLVLAGELSRRGARDVWFATDEPRRLDGEAMSAVSWDDEVYRQVTQTSRFRAYRATVRQTYRPALAFAKYQQLEAVVDKVHPALMIIDCETRYAIDLA